MFVDLRFVDHFRSKTFRWVLFDQFTLFVGKHNSCLLVVVVVVVAKNVFQFHLSPAVIAECFLLFADHCCVLFHLILWPAWHQFNADDLCHLRGLGSISRIFWQIALWICRILKGLFAEYLAFSNNSVSGCRICPHFLYFFPLSDLMDLRHQSNAMCIIMLVGEDSHPWSATNVGNPIIATIPVSSSAPRPLGAAYVLIVLSEVAQEQRPSGNGDREEIVVGAGLCDGEGEHAYTVDDPILGEEKYLIYFKRFARREWSNGEPRPLRFKYLPDDIAHTTFDAAHSSTCLCDTTDNSWYRIFLLTDRYLSRCYTYPMLNHFYRQLQL